MQNQFKVTILANNEPKMLLDFNFGGDYAPENKSEVIGTITTKFNKLMQMNKRWKQRNGLKLVPKISSQEEIDFLFEYNGIAINTNVIAQTFGSKFHFRMNKTIEEKLEHFLNDAIELAMIDEICEAKFIQE